MPRLVVAVLVCVAGASRLSAQELDPAALLKKAKEQYELAKKDLPTNQPDLPLAAAECLCGDREAGRSEMAAVAAAVKDQKDVRYRLLLYAKIIQSQLVCGLLDDARQTLAASEADVNQVPESEWDGIEFDNSYFTPVINALADAKADDDAIRLVETRRTGGGRGAKEGRAAPFAHRACQGAALSGRSGGRNQDASGGASELASAGRT